MKFHHSDQTAGAKRAKEDAASTGPQVGHATIASPGTTALPGEAFSGTLAMRTPASTAEVILKIMCLLKLKI